MADYRGSYVICYLGKLEVKLLGCQDLIENVPGRTRGVSVQLPAGSPENRSTWMKGPTKSFHGRSSSTKYNVKPDDLSSKLTIVPEIKCLFSTKMPFGLKFYFLKWVKFLLIRNC